MSNVSSWMSWEGGVDLVACTAPGLEQPNVIVHVARMVHTPVGSAPSGMVLFAPEGMPPRVMGFVSASPQVGAYFGPNIFAGTPFEAAPVLQADTNITSGDGWCAARVQGEGFLFESRLDGLAALEEIRRETGALPFSQNVLEAVAASASLTFNGEEISLILPPVGLSGGAPAVWSPSGIYALGRAAAFCEEVQC